MGRNSDHSESPVRRRRSPSYRERSPGRHKSSHGGSSPTREKSASRHRKSQRDHSVEMEKCSGHTKSTKHPSSWSPSPRTKRLRRSRRNDMDGKSSRGRHDRSVSPSDRHHRSRHRSRSPGSNSRFRDEVPNSSGDEHSDDEDDYFAAVEALELEAKQSDKLAAGTNRVRGVTLPFNEPPDARKPDIRWRLCVSKAGVVLNDHPSCSRRHAVIQFRRVEKEQPDGTITKQVRPCVMDLGSTNKTFINDNPIKPQRYYKHSEKDTIKFGNSSRREYILLHENSNQ